jgi:hypothetical protein
VQAWFTAQGLHSEGWKKDIARLTEADPAFFDVVERWLAASDLASRHELFRDAVQRPLAPIGGPLPDGTVLPQDHDVWERLTTA